MAGALDFLTVRGPEPASYTPPTVNSDWAGNLVNNYQQGEQYGRLRQLQNLFKPGSPGADALARGDYGGVMQQLIQSGGAESASQMLPALVGAQTSQMIMGGGQGQLAGVGQQTPQAQQSALPTGGADPRGKIPVIIAAAQKYGVDPATAIRVARSEGLASFYGDNGRSGTAFQLYTHGGLGNEFQKETGLNPLDPKNEDAAIDWAMKNVARTGWGPYKGAAKVGIGPRQGIGVQTAAATPGQSDKLTPANRAAVDAMYPKTAAATPAVQQPPGATGTPPFAPKTNTEGTAAAATMPPAAASNNVGTGPAGIVGPQPAAAPATAQPTAPPPAQVAQAQPVAPPQAAPAQQPTGGGALLPGDSPTALANRQKADAYQMQQANALMANPMTKSAGEGMMERAKASMAITNAMQERLTKQAQMEYAAGLEPETAGRRQIAEAKGKRVGEVIEAGGKNARDTMNDLNTIEDAVRAGGDNITYGPGAENWNKAKQFLNNIFPEAGLAEADTIIKMNARLAAAAAKSMTARPSQLEFKTFVANNPGIMNSKAGTIALINILKQSTQQSLDLGALASKVKNPDDWADQEENYYKTHKLMSPFTGKAMDEAPAIVPMPTVGDVVNGHRFKGGDPKKTGFVGTSNLMADASVNPWEMNWDSPAQAPPSAPSSQPVNPWERNWGGSEPVEHAPDTQAPHKFGLMDTWPVRLAKSIGHSIYSAVTLPHDVYKYGYDPSAAGGVDPLSQEGIGRAAETAMIFNPVEPGVTAGRGALGAIPKPRVPGEVPLNVQAAQAAQGAGESLPGGLVSPNPIMRATTRAAESLPLVGPGITEQIGKSVEAAGEQTKGIVDELRQGATARADVGEAARPGVEQAIKNNNDAMSAEYKDVKSKFDTDKPFELPETETVYNNILKTRAKLANPGQGLQDVAKLLERPPAEDIGPTGLHGMEGLRPTILYQGVRSERVGGLPKGSPQLSEYWTTNLDTAKTYAGPDGFVRAARWQDFPEHAQARGINRGVASSFKLGEKGRPGTTTQVPELGQLDASAPASEFLKLGIEPPRQAGGATFDELQRVRSDFGGKINYGDNPGYNDGERKALYGAMSRDMENIAREGGGEDAVTALKAAHGNAQQYIEQNKNLRSLLNKSSNEGLAGALIGHAAERTGNIKLLGQLKAQMPPEAFQQVSGQLLHELGHNPASNSFSLSQFGTNWNKLSQDAKNAMFEPGHRQTLDGLANMGKFIKNTDKYKNFAQTAHSVAWLEVLEHVADAVGEAVGGNFKPALKTAAGIGMGAVFGKVLARPASAAAVARWTRAAQSYGLSPSIKNRVAVNVATRNLISNLGSEVPKIGQALSPQAASPDSNNPPSQGNAPRLQVRIP